MLKRSIIFLTIAAVLSMGMITPAFAANAPSSWAKDEVEKAIASNLIPADFQADYQGYTTRKDFCRLIMTIVSVLGGEKAKSAPEADCPFTDTADIDIVSAYSLGIVNGRSSEIFDPDSAIIRQEAAAMLTRAAKALGMSTSAAASKFVDNNRIALYAGDAVNFVSEKGIMRGIGGNTFSPAGICSREQAIVTCLRLFNACSDNQNVSVKEVTVENVTQFVEAIGPNTKIVMKPGKYALGSEIPVNEYVSWDAVFEGFELSIKNVVNLTIEGSLPGASEITIPYEYAFVLSFVDCKDITVRGIVAGHSATGSCEGGVIGFSGCVNAVIDNTLMYGCGAVGVVAKDSKHITVKDSSIYECSYSILSVENSSNVTFTNCDFYDNKEFYQVVIQSSEIIKIDGCRFVNNQNLHEDWAFFDVWESAEISVKNCLFRENKSVGGLSNSDIIKFENNTMENNTW